MSYKCNYVKGVILDNYLFFILLPKHKIKLKGVSDSSFYVEFVDAKVERSINFKSGKFCYICKEFRRLLQIKIGFPLKFMKILK